MRTLTLLAVGLAVVLGLACGPGGDDINCTNNGGVCSTNACTSGNLPYACGSGGTCCKVPPDSGH